jgi:ketosteroid isomerase-like protein
MITKRQAIAAAPASLLAAATTSSKESMAQTIEGTPRPADLAPEIMAIVETVFKAFNSKDFESFKSVYGNNVVVVDGFAPYRWTGENALKEWWDEGEEWDKRFAVEKRDLAYKGILASGVLGPRGYTSISAVFTMTLKDGKSIVRPGILALTYAKLDEGWKVDGQAWGRLS